MENIKLFYVSKLGTESAYLVLFVPCKIYFLLDMIKRRNLRTRSIKMLILDESDEMLNKGIQFVMFVRCAVSNNGKDNWNFIRFAVTDDGNIISLTVLVP